MRNKLSIIISSPVGCGKSTIAASIYNLLTLMGFKVNINDEGPYHLSMSEISKRRPNLNNIDIEIETRQTGREDISNIDDEMKRLKSIEKEYFEYRNTIFVKNSIDVKSKLYKTILEIIKNNLIIEPECIQPESNFSTDLGADSLDMVELIMATEEEFDITIEDKDAEKLKTVADAYLFLQGVLSNAGR